MKRLRILATIVILIAPAWATQVLGRVVVSPTSTTVPEYQSRQFVAQSYDTTGKLMKVSISWTTSNPHAKIGMTGLFTSTLQGRFTVTAHSGIRIASAIITVTAPSHLASLVVSPLAVTVLRDSLSTLTVHGYDQYAKPFGVAAGYRLVLGSGVPVVIASQAATSVTLRGNAVAYKYMLYLQTGAVRSAAIVVNVLPPVSATMRVGQTASILTTWMNTTSMRCVSSAALVLRSSDPAVASVNYLGNVFAHATGTTVLLADCGGLDPTVISNMWMETLAVLPALPALPPVLARIAVMPTSASVVVGNTQQFSAQGFDQYSHSIAIPALTWRTSNGDATVANTGVAAGVSTGSVSIEAVSGVITGSAVLTVTPRIATSLTITPVPNLVVGQIAQSTATVKDQFGVAMSVPVSWYSSSPAATVTNGLVTGVSAGDASIGASYGSLSNASGFTVIARVLATIAVISPASSIYTGAYGSTAQLTAQGFDQFGVPFSAAFTWSSDNAAVATVGTGGLVTGVTPGTAHISAHSETLTGSIAMTVVQEPSILTTITVSPGSGTTYVDGKPFQFSAIARDQFNNLLNVAFTWTSTAPATVDSTGLVTGVGAGTANITASASLLTPELNKTFTAISNVATLSVGSAPALHSITTYPPSVTLAVAEPIGDLPNTTPLGATSIDQYGSTLQETYTWTSSNPAVASVDASGNVVGLAVGTAQITASALGVNSTATTINVTNAPSVLTTLTVGPTSPSVFPGGIVTLTPTALDQFNNLFPVAFTWLSDSSNATVNGQGNVTGVVAGTANITVYAGSLSASSAITIEQLQDVSGAWVFTFITFGGGTAQITAALQQSAGAITCATSPAGGINAFYDPPSTAFNPTPIQYDSCGGSNVNDLVTLWFKDYPNGNITTLTGAINPAAPTSLNGNITGSTPQDYQFAGAFTGQHQ